MFACRQTRQFFPLLNKKLSIKLCQGPRRIFSVAVHLVSGHNRLRRHEALVRYGTDDTDEADCSYCGEDTETTYHIISSCPAFAAARMEVFGHFYIDPPFKASANQLVRFVRLTDIPAFTYLLGDE